jgi:hypothetical protein
VKFTSWLSPRLSIGPAARAAIDLRRRRGRALSRAALLYDLGDALLTSRPRGWRLRALRAYDGAARRIEPGASPFARPGDAAVSGSGTPIVVDHAEVAASDLALQHAAARARRSLAAARQPYRRFWWSALALAVAAALSLLVMALLVASVVPPVRHWLFPRDVARNASWVASSAFPGHPRAGVGPWSEGPFFVHTASEAHPWVAITLPRVARLRKIRIENRSDCCQEREIPLNVEIDDAGGSLICQRHAPFSTWTCYPKQPVRASTIRISLPAGGMLHLRKVAVFE